MQKDKKKSVTLIVPECSFPSCVWENPVPQKIDNELKNPTVKSLGERLLHFFTLTSV